MEPGPDQPPPPPEDLAEAWRGWLRYAIRVTPDTAYFDAKGCLHIDGELHNIGHQPIEIANTGDTALLIGARVLSASGTMRAGAEARAGIAAPTLHPGQAAPFRMHVPGFDATAGDRGIQLSLVREGHFWCCDLGFPALTLALGHAEDDDATPKTEPPTDMTEEPLMGADSDPIVANDRAPEQRLGALDVYQQQRLGTVPVATLDDVWNCYRLLLNRNADPEGFEAYAAGVQQGMSVEALVRLFLSSPEFAHQLHLPRGSAPVQVRVNGMELLLPEPQTPAERHMQATGSYKPHLIGAFSSVLAPGQFVIDIGAHVGEFTIPAARKVGPRGRVVALEPHPEHMRLLLANLRSHAASVDVLPFAASDADGFVTLLRRGSIVTARETTDEDLTGSSAVEVIYARTIDSIVPEDQRVDVVRIDVDGFDYRALAGAERTLTRWHPHLFTDFAPGLLHEFSGCDTESYFALLSRCGYNQFTAISREHGPIDLKDDIAKLAELPAKLGTAQVEFYAQAATN